MKLKKGVIITDVSEKKVLVDAGSTGECFQGIIKLNESAALLAENLLQDITIDELVALFEKNYDIDKETARADIVSFLDQLRETGMLED